MNVPELHLETKEPLAEAVVQREFIPSYAGPDGKVVLLNDSEKAEPGLAVTLLRGLALSRDVDQVPAELLSGLDEMCSHLVQDFPCTLLSFVSFKFLWILTFALLGRTSCFKGLR